MTSRHTMVTWALACALLPAACGGATGADDDDGSGDQAAADTMLGELVPAIAGVLADALQSSPAARSKPGGVAHLGIDLSSLCSSGSAALDGAWAGDRFTGSIAANACVVPVLGGVTVNGSASVTVDRFAGGAFHILATGNLTVTWTAGARSLTLTLEGFEIEWADGAPCYYAADLVLGAVSRTFERGEPGCAGDGGPPTLSCTGRVVETVDDFDGGALDPGWGAAMLAEATAWGGGVAGGQLTVDDITPGAVHSGNGFPWSTVEWSRAMEPVGDFVAEIDLSWDSGGDVAAMQELWLTLAAGGGARIGLAGFSDAWVGGSGSSIAYVGADGLNSGANSLPLSGSATAVVTRIGGQVEVRFGGGAALITGASDAPLDHFALTFGYYPYATPAATSTFGSLAVSRVRVRGCAVE